MKVRFALVALALSAAPLAAQGGGQGRMMRGVMNVDQMSTTLSLTADQKTKYQGVLDNYMKMMQPLQTYMRAQMQAGAEVSADSQKKMTDAPTDGGMPAIPGSAVPETTSTLGRAGS